MKVLLVQPEFPIPKKSRNHKNFLPIGLLKIGTYLHKKRGAKVELIYGNKRVDFKPDEIWVTSLFTYWSEYFWDSVKFYRKAYPGSKIRVGGIYVSLSLKNHQLKQSFKEKCETLNIKPHSGLYLPAEKFQPDYSLVPTNPHPLDYQIIHASRGCPRHCSFCYTWKLEPQFNSKKSISEEICSNKLVFYDNNLLKNENIGELLEEVANLKWDGKAVRCESQSGFDGRILEERPELAVALKKARFDYPRIAWDWGFDQWQSIEKQINILKDAGYSSKSIYVFMIYNWKLSFEEMEKKRKKCWEWKIQITDCRYRPITQLHDYFDARKKAQFSEDYHINDNWTDAEVKQFRRNVRKQNICVRHDFAFHSGKLERKSVSKKESMKLRNMPQAEVRMLLLDAWYPEMIHECD